MLIIDKLKLPQPMYVRHEKPSFNTTYEKDKYWEQEQIRWKEGYYDLSGIEYFYLQEIVIKNAQGQLIRPHWRDCDHLIFDSIKKCIDSQHDLFVMKRREIGLSTIGGGCLPIYFALNYPGSTELMTSADKNRIQELFSQKTMIAYNNLDSDIKPAKARTKQEGYLFLAEEDKKSKTFSGIQSTIWCRETVDKPDNFEAYRSMYCFLDELFLHPKSNAVRNSTARCMMDGSEKKGFMLLGGTAGESSHLGSKEAKKLYLDAQHKNILTLFLKGTLGIKQFSVNGWSDEQKAEEWILSQRERLDKAIDKTDYWKFITDYPLTEDEVLSINNESRLPKDIMIRISQRKKEIMNNPPPVYTYSLSRSTDGSVNAEPDKKGKFYILEHPDEKFEYGSGTDPIPFNDSKLDEGSEYCIAIKKRNAETYVAYYAERSLDASMVVQNSILLQDYYNRVPTMLERNAGGAVYHEYKNLGRLDLLANKPTALGIKFEDSRTSKGIYKNDKTGARGNELLIRYLLKNVENLYFIRQIDELEKFIIDNTDLVDAMIMCEFQDADRTVRDNRKWVKPEYREIPQIRRDASGKTYIEMVKKKAN